MKVLLDLVSIPIYNLTLLILPESYNFCEQQSSFVTNTLA